MSLATYEVDDGIGEAALCDEDLTDGTSDPRFLQGVVAITCLLHGPFRQEIRFFRLPCAEQGGHQEQPRLVNFRLRPGGQHDGQRIPSFFHRLFGHAIKRIGLGQFTQVQGDQLRITKTLRQLDRSKGRLHHITMQAHPFLNSTKADECLVLYQRIIGLLGVSEGLSGMAMGIHGRRVQCAVRLRHAGSSALIGGNGIVHGGPQAVSSHGSLGRFHY